MISATRRRGYVLLMTLLLIALAGVALASIERLSLSRALDAAQAEHQLQRRWLATSFRAALLPRASAILEQAQVEGGEAVTSRPVNLTIGGYQVALVFTDEQSKPNVNTLWSTRDPEECARSLERLLDGCPTPPSPTITATINLEPTPQELSGAGAVPFGTFGQVFKGSGPAYLLGAAGFWDGAASRITLWGSGKLNFHRTTREALIETCTPVLGLADVEKILAIRQQQPSIGTGRLLDLLELSKERRTGALGRLTDQSSCFGLWIVITGSGGTWHSFVAGTNDGTAQSPLLEW